MSPVTERREFTDDKEALEVLERAGIAVPPGGVIRVPMSHDLDRDQELESALDCLSNEWDYLWHWA